MTLTRFIRATGYFGAVRPVSLALCATVILTSIASSQETEIDFSVSLEDVVSAAIHSADSIFESALALDAFDEVDVISLLVGALVNAGQDLTQDETSRAYTLLSQLGGAKVRHGASVIIENFEDVTDAAKIYGLRSFGSVDESMRDEASVFLYGVLQDETYSEPVRYEAVRVLGLLDVPRNPDWYPTIKEYFSASDRDEKEAIAYTMFKHGDLRETSGVLLAGGGQGRRSGLIAMAKLVSREGIQQDELRELESVYRDVVLGCLDDQEYEVRSLALNFVPIAFRNTETLDGAQLSNLVNLLRSLRSQEPDQTRVRVIDSILLRLDTLLNP